MKSISRIRAGVRVLDLQLKPSDGSREHEPKAYGMGPRRSIVPAERGHLPAVSPADRASTAGTGDLVRPAFD
jgi:hypothetical protein